MDKEPPAFPSEKENGVQGAEYVELEVHEKDSPVSIGAVQSLQPECYIVHYALQLHTSASGNHCEQKESPRSCWLRTEPCWGGRLCSSVRRVHRYCADGLLHSCSHLLAWF